MPSRQTSFFLMPALPPGHSPSRGIQNHGMFYPKACSDRNTTHSGRKRPNCSAPYLSVPELNSKGKGGLLPTCAVSMLGFWQHRRAHSSSSPELMGPWGCLSKGNAENPNLTGMQVSTMNRSVWGTRAQLRTAEKETLTEGTGASHTAWFRGEGEGAAAPPSCTAGFTRPFTKYQDLVKYFNISITQNATDLFQIQSRFQKYLET